MITITIIGAGNLSRSILDGIERSKSKYNINIIDVDRKKRSIAKRYDASFSTIYSEKNLNSDFVLLISKPKEYKKVIKSIAPHINEKTIILSFMAGITISQIKKSLGRKNSVLRCMTNLAISFQSGYVFYYAKPLSKKILARAQGFLSDFSYAKRCIDEDQIDKLTALYGSGPAYYVFFNDVIRQSFMKMGFSTKESILYTNSLIYGSSKLINNNSDTNSLLNSIASKGGTTEAALKHIKKNSINLEIRKALEQAYKRSKRILDK